MGRDRGLTKIKVEALKPNPRKRVEIADSAKPGLYLVVQPSGKKSWAVRYRRRSDRKPRKLTLEGFCTLGTARKLAQAALDKVAEGGDPTAEKRTKQAVQPQTSDLVEVVFADFLTRHIRKKNGAPIRETRRRETARMLGFKRGPGDAWVATGNGVAARWWGCKIQDISRRDVLDLLDDLVETSPVGANRTLSVLKTCFTWRVRRDRDTLAQSVCADIDNPAPERTRERVLGDIELAALWRAADDRDGFPFGRMVQLLLLTGCRRDEVRLAVWSEFDLAARTWTIPAHRTKNNHPHVVPLTDKAMTILEGLPRIKGTAGLLFTTTGTKPISGLAKMKARLHAAMNEELAAEPEWWTLHDLRRTFVTGLQRLGFPMEVTEACVNHRGGTLAGVAGIYARHDYAQEKRAAADTWARHVDALVSGKAAKIVPLSRGVRR